MRIAVPDFVSSTFFPLIAAKALGIFEEEGEDVEIVLSNALGAVKYLRDGAGDISAGQAHAPMMFFPEWRGVKLVAAVSQGTPWMLVMKAGLAKRGEIAAVKGRRIAANAGPDLVFKHLLREAGIDMERDRVEVGPLREADQPGISFGVAAAKALAEGKVDGIWANVLLRGCGSPGGWLRNCRYEDWRRSAGGTELLFHRGSHYRIEHRNRIGAY